MNELDAIQAQMASLGVDVSPNQQMPQQEYVPSYQLEDSTLTQQDIDTINSYPNEETVGMPEYDLEALEMDIAPFLQWLPKEEYANLILWISEQWNILNNNNTIDNA